jgi:uncharacterized protein YdeI (YjbR/CyaY-like superfamily)
MKSIITNADSFFSKTQKWHDEFVALRNILLPFQLQETIKWGWPCYMLHEKNVVLMHGFKHYCALLFFKGALLNNADGLLIQQTPNVQASRQIRFTNLSEIIQLKKQITKHIKEAIEVEQAGLTLAPKPTNAFAIPVEFDEILKQNNKLKKAFHALTPGRQRAYLLYFAQAKQSATRLKRIQNYLPYILAGKGLHDVTP